MEKKLSVSAIKQGTVIDHVTAGNALRIVRLLDLPSGKKQVTVGLNLPSIAFGYKDIIKVSERELTADEANKIAILAPRATINIIKNYKIIKKFKVQIPETIQSVIICPNPVCVTNNEKITTFFYAQQKKYTILLRCKYCLKEYSPDKITEYHT
ncbi:MAG: aspartate carbamoyltransferase regulatory subunit [Candidatus Doudnabacteria bacterium RIFCSPHIGHO2_01_FULL_43_23]|uniref:Aspartate carbamoyltransferase regulatory chain n=1 Tax=Candidatus Doudnabacteria bacterium RIFCSPHIGHO2_01_FULL_43_23 TaxID=1817822 RepID=A0A1F5NUI6_9BACT|nr:MAG: aspartate carbamoyltransferase regulatory subunit [Candidatus Doudnabacteria bacterium RIFCSPHIGHO2_01_FULL_43_23]